MPTHLIDELKDQALEEVKRRYEKKPLLLIKLGPDSDELLQGLEYTSGLPMQAALTSLSVMTYDTVLTSIPARLVNAVSPERVQQLLNARLKLGRHYVIPLCKRGRNSDPLSVKVSVGRATNKDVVLRHRSTSKFHAWFERAGDGAVCVFDAGSKNGTAINGEAIAPREPAWLSPMDTISFGSVECCFCPAENLARAL